MASELDYSVVPADNTAINGVGITGSDKPSNLDDAMRYLAANRANAQPRGTAKSANYSAVKDDFGKLFSFSGAYTLTIPSISSVANGWFIYAEASDSAPLTIARSGSNTINGATSVALPAGGRCRISVGVSATDVKVDFYSRSIVVSSKSADYTVVAADANALISVDASGANRTITLPSLSSVGNGFSVEIKKSDTSFNTVTITGTVDGVANKVLRLPDQSVVLVSDNTAGTWRVEAEAGTVYSGSNANGRYTRFADGTQICSHVGVPNDASSAVGSVFRSASSATWTFPIAFSTTTGLAVSGTPSNNARWLTTGPPTTTSVTIQHFQASNSAANIDSQLMATGRWF